MPTLNGILVDHFLQPLLDIARSAWSSIWVIDCLNYATMYPQFFNRVSNDPTVYYIFVVRGNFTAIPDKQIKPFGTTCPGVTQIRDQNVMVISVCSSYMYNMKINTTPRCNAVARTVISHPSVIVASLACFIPNRFPGIPQKPSIGSLSSVSWRGRQRLRKSERVQSIRQPKWFDVADFI